MTTTFLGWALEDTGESPLVEMRHAVGADRLAVVSPESPPHELDVGSTGGGKSTLLRVAAIDLVQQTHAQALQLLVDEPDELERERQTNKIIICDGKRGNGFKFLQGQPGITALPNGVDEITDAILTVYEETKARFAEYDAAREQAWGTHRAPDYAAPGWLYFIIDEFMSYILQVEPGRGELQRQSVLNALVNLGQLSREARVRLRLATQRPDAKSVDVGLPGSLKAQLKTRVAVPGQMGFDGTESYMAFDDYHYREKVGTTPGIGLVKVGAFEHRFRVPFVPDPTDPDRKITQGQRDAVWNMLPIDPRPVGDDPEEVRRDGDTT